MTAKSLRSDTLPNNSHRIAVIGAAKVGKTSLILRFVVDQFFEDLQSPEEDYKKQVEVDAEEAMLEILDTADRSDEIAVEVRDHCIKHSQGFLILYDVTNTESFERCPKFHHTILSLKNTDCVPVLLVATKCDIPDRVVSTAQGAELAKQHGWAFIETSAKDKINTNEVFDEIVRQIRKHNCASKK